MGALMVSAVRSYTLEQQITTGQRRLLSSLRGHVEPSVYRQGAVLTEVERMFE